MLHSAGTQYTIMLQVVTYVSFAIIDLLFVLKVMVHGVALLGKPFSHYNCLFLFQYSLYHQIEVN